MDKFGAPWYPEDIGGHNYVYFSSLFFKNPTANLVAREARDYLYSQGVLGGGKTDYLKTEVVGIEGILSFLTTIINNERQKETAFLNFLNLNKKLDIKPPSLDSDWSDFIKEVQEHVNMGRLGLTHLKNEQKRLINNIQRNENNKEKYSDLKDYERAQRGYQRSANYKTTDSMKKVMDFLSGKNRSTIGRTVLNYILSHFKNELLIIDSSGNLALNQSQLASLIAAASQIVLNSYYSIVENLQQENTGNNKKYTITKDLEKVLNEDKTIEQQIRTAFSNINNLPYLAKEFQQDYNITTSNRKNKDYTELAQKRQRQLQAEEELKDEYAITAKDLQQYFSNHNLESVFSGSIKIEKLKSLISEIQVQAVNAVQGAIYSSNTGKLQGKTDNLIAYLHISMEDFLNDSNIDKFYKKIDELRKKMERLENTFEKSESFGYYQNQEQNWQKAINEMQEIISDMEKEYDILANCFIVEESTKSYESLFVKRVEGQKEWTTFSGGSIGANIGEQIAKINNLATIGGIGFSDENWLLNACINAGPSMIGHANKKTLEDYFAAMAAILLFDNQITIAKEAFNPPQSHTSIKQIHLFTVNSGTFPLSYILQLTKNYLETSYSNIQQAVISHGAQAEISGFVAHPPSFIPGKRPLNEGAWNNLSAAASAETKIKITFLDNFLALLNNFFKPEL